jgi:hypothetical protein
MLARKTISFLALSALIVLPAGIASAEVRVQTDNANVIVGGGNGVQIYSTPRSANIFRRSLSGSIVVPTHEVAPGNIFVRSESVSVDDDEDDEDDDAVRDVRVYRTPQRSRIIRTPVRIYRPTTTQNWRTWKTLGRDSSMQCNKRSTTHRSVQRNSSSTSVNQTYSSQTSTTCR